MSLQFYSARKDVTGAMASWSFNSKDGSVWLRLMKQTGVKTSAGGGTNGTYAGGATVNVKFNIDEVGGIIRSARNLEKVSFFHKSPTTTTTINLNAYVVPASGTNPEKTNYGLSVKQGQLEFKIGLSAGQAEALAQYLEFALGHIFSADYSEDKKRALDAAKKKAEGGTEQEGPVQEAPEGSDDF